MDTFNITIEKNSRDCDGAMNYKPIEMEKVTSEILLERIRRVLLAIRIYN